MDDIIPYSLRAGEVDSTGYYRTIGDFTGFWLRRADEIAGPTIGAFQGFLMNSGKPARTLLELSFEGLALGVQLREHAGQARQKIWALRLQRALLDFQNRYPQSEQVFKAIRGLVNGLVWREPSEPLKPEDVHHRDAIGITRRVIHWLHAYEEDTLAGRLSTWMKFFLTLEPSRIEKVICDCLEMAGEFARESEFSLGKYTEGVERYLNQNQRQRRWRYDVALLSHTRLEYHLGMLGTEILSRTYRPLFNQTQRKVVIVPPCMRRQGDTCQGVLTPFGARCRACDPACAVHQLTKLGEKKGFEVFTIPDDLRKFSGNPSQSRPEIGVVGISCALTNWTGGWDLQKIGIPGQGVLLDYPGCQYHWSKHGVVTAVNFDPISRLCQEGVWDKS